MNLFIRMSCVFAITLLLAGCGKSAESTPGLTTPTLEPAPALMKDSKIQLAQTSEGIQIFTNKPADGDLFKEITIQANGLTKTFAWQTSSNPSYYPIVKSGDFFKGNKDELAVVLTKGHGTGILRQEIHILNVEDLSELPIENPVDAIKREVKSELTKRDDKVTVGLEANGVKITKDYEKSAAASWNETVAFGDTVVFEIEEGNIIANLPGAVSPAPLIVADAVVSYGNDLKVNKVELTEGK